MSGHSHYATIKRQKGINDAQKGALFSKLAKEVIVAVKSGGGADPQSNFKLRVAIDRARASNMPKENIERILSRAQESAEAIEEATYEGFGPSGIAIFVEVATDNRNRTGQEIKNLFERGGGSLGGPGSVSFNFEAKGLLVVKKTDNVEEQLLDLIDAGVDEEEETNDAIEVYVSPDKLSETREKLISEGFEVSSMELTKKPKNLELIQDPSLAQKVLQFLDSLENHEDVQKVYTNIDIPDEVLDKIKS